MIQTVKGANMSLVIAVMFFGLGSMTMVLAFKASNFVDDHGYSWWWCPLVVFALLSLFLLGQGVESLRYFFFESG
jgi:hypothetical protein